MTCAWIFRTTQRCRQRLRLLRRETSQNEQIGSGEPGMVLRVERQGASALLLSIKSFDVRTATTFPESRAGRGPCPDTRHGKPRGAGHRVHQKGNAGVAAAAVAVCAGAVLRVPGRAGDGAAVVDADLGPQHVHSGAAAAGSSAV